MVIIASISAASLIIGLSLLHCILLLCHFLVELLDSLRSTFVGFLRLLPAFILVGEQVFDQDDDTVRYFDLRFSAIPDFGKVSKDLIEVLDLISILLFGRA